MRRPRLPCPRPWRRVWHPPREHSSDAPRSRCRGASRWTSSVRSATSPPHSATPTTRPTRTRRSRPAPAARTGSGRRSRSPGADRSSAARSSSSGCCRPGSRARSRSCASRCWRRSCCSCSGACRAGPPQPAAMPSIRRFGVLLALALAPRRGARRAADARAAGGAAPAAARGAGLSPELRDRVASRRSPSRRSASSSASPWTSPPRRRFRSPVAGAARARASCPTWSRSTAPSPRPCSGTRAASSGSASGRAATRSGSADRCPPRANVEIPLPLRPQRVEWLAPPRGWTLLGLDADGRVEGALQLVRDAAPEPGGEAERRLEPTAIPSFVSVERTLLLGTSWQVTTLVQRVAPPEGAIVLGVPLLPGESVTTPGVRVAERARAGGARAGRAVRELDQRARAGRGARARSAARRGLERGLAARREPALARDRGGASRPWTRPPRAGGCASGGPGRARRSALAVERPEGAGGETLTIDRSELDALRGPARDGRQPRARAPQQPGRAALRDAARKAPS